MADRRPPPPRVQIVLQQHRRGERVDVLLAAASRAPQLTDRLEYARRGHPLVPQLDRPPRAAPDVVRQGAGLASGRALGSVGREGEADHHGGHAVVVEQREQLAHGEAFTGAAGEGGKWLREHPTLVRQREADAALAPVHSQQPPPGRNVGTRERRNVGRSFHLSIGPAFRHPCAIVAKNSLFVLVRFMRSSKNSIASTGGMSERKLRSR